MSASQRIPRDGNVATLPQLPDPLDVAAAILIEAAPRPRLSIPLYAVGEFIALDGCPDPNPDGQRHLDGVWQIADYIPEDEAEGGRAFYRSCAWRFPCLTPARECSRRPIAERCRNCRTDTTAHAWADEIALYDMELTREEVA